MATVSEASQAEINNMMRRNSSPHIFHNGSTNGFVASKPKHDGNELCRVCGDSSAKMHYGVLTCFGCKGFFRRALKRPTEYQCRHNGQCVVDKHERNSCRYCRFKKCLEVGMDPKAVRPDRDATGRHQGRARRARAPTDEEHEIDAEWTRKLPVDMRTMLMQLMNTDVMVNSGDAPSDARSIYPLPYSLKQLLEDTSLLDGKKTEMRYEAFRQVDQAELPFVAHRRLLAVVDWVDHLFDMMDLHAVEDKLTLVKCGFAPLSVLCFSASTATSTRQADVLCQCNYGFVPRNIAKIYDEPYHLANRVVSRSLDELVTPFRQMAIREEEIVLLKAILLLNPQARPLSFDAQEAVADLRDRIQETLYHVVRETHPKEVASSRFGNLLLFLPAVYMIGNMVVENLQFVDSIMHQLSDPLVKDFLALQDEEDETRGLNAEQVLDERPLSSTLSHSASSSSLDSLGSHGSHSSHHSHPSNHASPSDLNQHYQQNGMSYNLSSSSLPGMVSQFNENGLNAATSMPNLGPMVPMMNGHHESNQQNQQMADNDDPDYNLTLTPDMATGIRQAMSIAHNLSEHGLENGQGMEIDQQQPPALVVQQQQQQPQMLQQPIQQQQQQQQPQQRTMHTPPGSPMDRPQFFISTVESTKHKFTVTTSFDRYGNGNYNVPPTMGVASSPYLPQMNGQPQQPLARTNSLPPHQQFSSVPIYTQQPPTFANQPPPQSMEFDENYYNR